MPTGSVISLEHTLSLIAGLTVHFDTFCIIACHLINYVRVIEELSQNSSQPNEVRDILSPPFRFQSLSWKLSLSHHSKPQESRWLKLLSNISSLLLPSLATALLPPSPLFLRCSEETKHGSNYH